ncbi:hypothetical protein CYLTODRAFT_70257 [Cylindrobasidium torrendii FP15055 ss-10]|uniref:Uncharacterized protein n=1 Tax=Cylindrobasidium torrendii FP15055 ss-10 TaxID=1314674 RepID=A0A0D7BPD0_9AGAR|nr:hypothetical protein CYLTODRAFT_70257 [Cylindrobasidium torrendii FP15055 ss-10]
MMKRSHGEIDLPVSITSSVLTPVPSQTPKEYLQELHDRRDALRLVDPMIPWADSDNESETSDLTPSAERTKALREKAQQLLALRGTEKEGIPNAMMSRVLSLACTKGGRHWLPQVNIVGATSSAATVPLQFEPEPALLEERSTHIHHTRSDPDVTSKIMSWIERVEPGPPEEQPVKKTAASKAKGKAKAEADVKNTSPLGFTVSKLGSSSQSKGKDNDQTPIRKKRKLDSAPSSPFRTSSRHARSSPPKPIKGLLPAAKPRQQNTSTEPLLDMNKGSLSSSPVLAPRGSTHLQVMAEDEDFIPPSFPSHLEQSTPHGMLERPAPISHKPLHYVSISPANGDDEAHKPVATVSPIEAGPPKRSRVEQLNEADSSSIQIQSPSPVRPLLHVEVHSPVPGRLFEAPKTPLRRPRSVLDQLGLFVDNSPAKSLSSIAGENSEEEDGLKGEEDEVNQQMFASTQMGRYNSQMEENLEDDVEALQSFLEDDIGMDVRKDSVAKGLPQPPSNEDEEEEGPSGTGLLGWMSNFGRSVSRSVRSGH